MRWLVPLLVCTSCWAQAQTGNVIFLHPDGTSAAAWTALRFIDKGPDGLLNWDRMPHVALYRGHMTNALTASSNGGGVAHAYGTRVGTDSFGLNVTSASGRPYSLMVEAKRAGMAIGIVNSASVTDAGTGTFLARVALRRDHNAIALQMLGHRPEVLLGGGEQWFLPKGTQGRHGVGERTDGRNLVEEARRAGYTVVFTKDELARAAPRARRILGLFAADDTFNDESEETLAREGKPLFQPQAPRYDAMVQAALQVLRRSGKRFFLNAEEEGSDNFAGDQNASGVIESLRGADRAIGHAVAFAARSRTLVLTTSDSNCAGMTLIGEDFDPSQPLPERDDETGSAIDGVGGTGTRPFLSAPDRTGRRLPFAVGWGAGGDTAAGMIARAHGVNASLLNPNASNTDMYRLMYRTLFGRWPSVRR